MKNDLSKVKPMTFKEALIECIRGSKIAHKGWDGNLYIEFTDVGFQHEDGVVVDITKYCQALSDGWEIYTPKVLKFPVVFQHPALKRYAVSQDYYKTLEEFSNKYPPLDAVMLLEDLGEFFEED